MSESKPDFLKSSRSASAPKDPSPSPAQKAGTITPDGSLDGLENRPQQQGVSEGNPKSIPSGGKLPFSPPKKPSLPARLK